MENLGYGIFALQPEAVVNDSYRDGTILLEYFQTNVTTSSDTGDVEVATKLEEVLGVISLNFDSEFGTADYQIAMSTDAVKTTGAVTVRVVGAAGWTDGSHTIRGFLVGRGKSSTVLLNSPNN